MNSCETFMNEVSFMAHEMTMVLKNICHACSYIDELHFMDISCELSHDEHLSMRGAS